MDHDEFIAELMQLQHKYGVVLKAHQGCLSSGVDPFMEVEPILEKGVISLKYLGRNSFSFKNGF